MSKMRRLLAAVLVASMILGSNGIAYAAEAAGADDTVSTVEVTEEAAEKESKSAADAELPDEPEEASVEEDSNEAVEASQDDSSETIESEEASEQSEPEEAPAEEVSSEEPADEEEASVEKTEADDSEDEDASAEENTDAESEEESADEAFTEESDEAASAEDASEVAPAEETSEEEMPEAVPAEAATEEAAAQATTQEAAQEVFTAGELVYHGSGYDVTMAYDEKAEIPADAQLKVREIKKGTDEYDAYLSGAQAASDKGVAEARFFDITIWAKGKEIQPKSAVRVNISYKKAIDVAEEGEVKAMHFEDGTEDPDILDTDTNGGSKVDEIAFDAESFSVYGVIYTVDFTYDGYTFSMPGEGSILLSELADELGLYEKDLDKAFSVSNVSDVTFTDYDLLKIEKQADGDWLLISLAPFSSEETLTVTMNDGVKFVIGVTDEQVSSNLTDFLTNAVITGATQDSEGRYEVEAGKEYNIILSFAESSAHQFDNHATLTYTMPDGLTILSQQTGDLKINIVYKGRTYQVDATYDLDINGNLEIKFDENDPDFHHLENSTNVSFRFSYYGAFDGSEEQIHFSQDIERDIVFEEPEPGQAYVTKSGTFDEETGKFNYTITVEATGDITNVNVKDVISGNALIFNNDVQVSGNSSSYTDNGATNGFDYTFDSMREGEVITITYSASVDFSKDTDKDGKITVDQTKNTATVKPEGGEPHTSEYSHEIAFKTTKKSNGENTGTTADGDKIYKWTITYNELRLASAGGDTIKDTIAADSTEYMKYYGDGLSIKVIDKNGNVVDTRNVPYSDLQSYSDSSWTYKIPVGDSQPYMYEITYYTVVDMEKVEGTGNTVTVINDANGSGGSADVTPESVISVTKSVDSFTTEKVNWSVTLGIPENGLTQAVVTDTFPAIWLNGNIYDLLEDGSLQITGLLDGESYSLDTDTQGKVKITFFQDLGQRITGLQAAPGGHTITVKLTTLVDQEWLQKGYETGGYEQTHTNKVDFNGKTAEASVIFGKPGIEKKGDALTDSEGNITGLKYTVVLKGVSETPVSVLDTFDTSILEVDTAKASSWDHMRIWGGNQWSQDAGRMPVSYTDTGDGIILTADSVPMQTDGSYYPYYRIVYYLKVKDGVDLKALAIANGGEYDVDNTVKWGDHESEFTYKVEYDYLDKQLLNEGELGGTSRTAKYQITFNPSKATLNGGDDMIMTDVLSANLSVDYSSISIVTEPAGKSVVYSLSGGEPGTGTTVATYTIPDQTKVTITYDANVRGNGSQKIVNKVSVNGKEETVENTKSYGSASEGQGAEASFKIVKVDGYDANKKLEGVKFKVFCENPEVDFGDGQKELILETDRNGEITFDGEEHDFYFNEVYHVQEIEAPEDYGTISFDYLVTLTNDMAEVDYGAYIYYYSDSMQIKNWPLEGLIVEKQVESDDPDDLEDYYHFRISVLNDDGSVNTDYNEKNGDDDFVNGVVEFDLKNREQKMFWGFAKGTKYKVEEIDAEGFVTTVKYSVYDADGNVTEVITDTKTTHSGELTQDDETIVFKNTKTSNGSLKLTKLVTVNGEETTGTEADGTYEFTITGPGADGEVSKTVTITVTNGVAASAKVGDKNVELDDGYVEVTDLEAGEYTITETTPTNGTSLVGGNDKKVTVVAGESGKDVSAKAEFTNNIDLGSLKIKKNVTVNGAATEGTEADGTYTFEVKDAEGTVVATKTITITNGESNEIQVDNLVPGTYTVSEDTSKLPEGKEMVLIGSNDVEIIVEAKNTANIPMAEFTNNKPGTPEFEKKIKDINDSTGETSGWQDSADYDIGDAVPYKLTATLPNDVSTNSSYSIKFEDQMENSLTFEEVSDVTLNGESIMDDCAIDSEDHSFTVSISWSGEAVTEALNGATVEVYFTATLNESAKIGSQGNVNAARLRYDNKSEITDDSGKTPWDYVIAFTYKLDVNKVDQDGKALTGAEFKLEKKLSDGTTKSVTLNKNEDGTVFTGTGLDDGDYVLTETTAPTGYKPIDPIEFTVTAEHGITWDYTSTGDEPAFNGGGRTGILRALTGATESGDIEFAASETLEGLEGTVSNERLGSLKIKKNVLVNGESTTGTSADGTYTFVIKDENNEEQATATITITNGESNDAQVDNLPAGTYTVSEDLSKNPEGMTIVGENSKTVVVSSDATAEIQTAEFTNDKTEVGSMKIKKNVTVNGEATTKTIADGDYTFYVKDKDGVTKATETITITNGKSKEVQIDNLPTGKYTVSEDTTLNPEGMSIVGENDIEVEVTADETAEIPIAEFTNNIDVGSLKIKKNVTVNGAATEGTEADGTYTFEVKDAEGTVVATKTITITNGESNEIQVDNLVPGTYTVSEDTSKLPEGKEMVLIGSNDVEIIVEAKNTANIPMAEFTNNKPGTPEFEKKIKDINDSTGDTSGWQDSADYDIGDAVPYKLTATLPNDVSTNSSYSIKFEDRMENSLTFEGVSKVTLNDDDITRDCTISPASGGQSFTVSISWSGEAVTEALNGATVEVYFTATLNESAKIGSQGNVNAARLRYDNKSEITDDSGKTPWDYVIAFTYKLDVNKVDQDGEALTGAEFKLEKKLSDGTTKSVTLNKNEAGTVFTGTGLDDGDYVLTETTAPTGYKPIDPIEFTVTAGHEVVWDYTSAELAFNGDGRFAILTALTGETDSGDLKFAQQQSLDGLTGTVTNQGIGALKIEKVVTGTTATDKSFKFEIALTAPADTELDSSYPATLDGEETDDAAVVDGKVTVTLTAGQVYEITGLPAGTTYTVTETELPDGYSEGTHTGTEGTIEVGGTAQVTMNNTYETAGKTVIGGVKVLEGRELKDGEFTFELKDENGDVVKTAANDADGNFSFEELTFTGEDLDTDADGNYIETTKTYTVAEKAGSDTTIAYDGSEYTVELTLTDVGNGNIEVVKNPEDAAAQTFTNTYEAKGEVTFGGKKTLEGRALTEGEFSFELKDAEGNVLETVTNDADGNYSFTTIKYTLADLDKDGGKYIPTEKVYTVSEVSGEDENVEYDDKVYTITCVLTDKSDNTIEVTTDEVPGACDFTNTYNTKGEITFSGKKTLENRALFAGEFTFELYDSEGTQIDLVFNEDDGSYSFSKIEYTGEDLDKDDDGNFIETTKTYKVVEKAGEESSVTYDNTEYEITVTLKDNGEGTIETFADPKEDTYDFTNTYETEGEITFSGEKTLENRKLTEGEFSFDLYDEDGTLLETVTNAADGSYNFTTIKYTGDDLDKDSAGNYLETIKNYRVVEKAGKDGSVTYDDTEYEITVTLTDNGKGTIEVTADPAEDSYDFTNTYNTKGEITFSGEKTLENRALTEGEFSFELYDSEGTLLKTATNKADGSYSFTTIEYTGDDLDKDADGYYVETTKTYKVVEKAGEDSSVTYDDTEYEITVTLTDDGEGTIAVTADPAEDSYDFTNTYSAKGSYVFEAEKILKGRPLTFGQFSFELYDSEGNLIQTAESDNDGSVTFEAIEYTQDDMDKEESGDLKDTVKTYTLKEVTKDDKGYTYSEAVYKIDVTLHDDKAGTIETSADKDKIDLTFTNIYKTEGEIVLNAQKELLGERALEEGQFTFELKDANGKVIDSKTNAADGSVTFDAIKYTQDDIYEVDPETGVYSGADTKTLTYTISEVIPEGAKDNGDGTFLYNGYTYDGTVYTVKVDVTDNGDGTITAQIAEAEGSEAVFTNAYAADGTLKLVAEKTLKNGTLKGNDFTFELKDADGNVLQSKKNDAAGNVSFDLITYELADAARSPITYTVNEVAEGRNGVKYDETVYTVTVTLEDKGDGTLKVTRKIDNGGKLKFVNEQLSAETSITLGGVKVLKGQKLQSGMFSFVLTDQNGKWIESTTNDANGDFTFGKITYKLADLKGETKKVYKYKIYEVKGSKSGIIYDTKVYTVNVTVTDNGDGTMLAKADMTRSSIKFVNDTEKKKKKRDSTKTGDEAPLGVLFGGLGIGAVGLAVLLEDRRRRGTKK